MSARNNHAVKQARRQARADRSAAWMSCPGCRRRIPSDNLAGLCVPCVGATVNGLMRLGQVLGLAWWQSGTQTRPIRTPTLV